MVVNPTPIKPDLLAHYHDILALTTYMAMYTRIIQGNTTEFKVARTYSSLITLLAMLSTALTLLFYKAVKNAAASGLFLALYKNQSVLTTVKGGEFFHKDHLKQRSIAIFIMTTGAILVIP